MNIHRRLRELIDSNAPYWAAEAEVVRTYWDWPRRSKESDRTWVLRQMYKELCEGAQGSLERIRRGFDPSATGVDGYAMRDQAKVLLDELSHYCRFADVYAALRENGAPMPDLATIRSQGNWPENMALMDLRAAHVHRHGELGVRAKTFTEGGYCTLFSEGMKRKGRGEVDDLIATACAVAYEDEFDHMLMGIAGIEEDALTQEDWGLLTRLTVEQLRHRILMRNAQFGFAVAEGRLEAMLAGRCAPLPFEYAKAALRARG